MRTLPVRLIGTPARAVVAAALIAAVVRVLFLGVPLVITNDGAGYLSWALMLRDGQAVDWPAFRTPGYSLFLCGLFALVGTGPVPVLLAQHGLGVACAAGIAWMASRWVRPPAAAAWGAVFALDPVFLAFECFALTETLSLALLVACACLALLPRRLGLVQAGALGAGLGALCLVRPAFQVVVPFFLLALMWAPALRGRLTLRLAGLALGACTFLAVVAPWVIHNSSRGIRGLSGSSSVYLWIGVNQAGLLDEEVPAEFQEGYDRLVRPNPTNDAAMHGFLGRVRAWDARPVQRSLRGWALRSIAQRPGGYLGAVFHAALWQLDVFPPSGFMRHNETRWLVRRAGRGAGREPGPANFEFTATPRPMDGFAMEGGAGPGGAYFRAFARNQPFLPVRVLLAMLAGTALVLAVARADWRVALILLALFAYWGAHAVLLLHNSRYALPCWGVWCVAPAYAWHARAVLARFRRARVKPG